MAPHHKQLQASFCPPPKKKNSSAFPNGKCSINVKKKKYCIKVHFNGITSLPKIMKIYQAVQEVISGGGGGGGEKKKKKGFLFIFFNFF
jgi:hypothetical protein